MKFEVTFLGVGAAAPTLRHNPTAQLVNVHDKHFLVDCGEGTQIQLRKFKLKFQRINQVFISHLHGDHFFGLLGLISSMHLYGRTKTLQIYGPAPLEEIVAVNLKHSQTFLNFPLEFIHTDPKEPQLLFEDNTLEVHSFPLKHRIACTGFIFKEKPRQPRIKKSTIGRLRLTIPEIIALKNCEDVTRENGRLLEWEKLTEPIELPRTYAFCSDTIYQESLVEIIRDCDLLYHEATFMHDMLERAKATFHTTARQAALLAKNANVESLVLGHFSARYRDLIPLLNEARSEFENTVLAEEGFTLEIPMRNV